MVTEKSQAPYAPVKNVLDVIRRRRERGLPDPVTLAVLQQVGVPEGNAPRTLQALRFLGLIDEEGHRTTVFDRLGNAPTSEYQEVLGQLLRAAYHSVFTLVDPAQDSDIAINDAFRQYQPESQRSRMITLFLGLSEEAGITQKPAKSRRRQTGQRQQRTRKLTRADTEKPDEEKPNVKAPVDAPPVVHADYRVIAAIVQQLPPEGKWSRSHRSRWIAAMTAAIDLMIEVEDDTPIKASEEASRKNGETPAPQTFAASPAGVSEGVSR